MFPSTILRVAALLFAASIASADVVEICAICPSTDTAGNALISNSGYSSLDPPEKFCGCVFSRGVYIAKTHLNVLATETKDKMDLSLAASTTFVLKLPTV